MFTLHGQTHCWSVSKDSNGWGINLNKEVGVVHHMKWEQWLSFSLFLWTSLSIFGTMQPLIKLLIDYMPLWLYLTFLSWPGKSGYDKNEFYGFSRRLNVLESDYAADSPPFPMFRRLSFDSRWHSICCSFCFHSLSVILKIYSLLCFQCELSLFDRNPGTCSSLLTSLTVISTLCCQPENYMGHQQNLLSASR